MNEFTISRLRRKIKWDIFIFLKYMERGMESLLSQSQTVTLTLRAIKFIYNIFSSVIACSDCIEDNQKMTWHKTINKGNCKFH